MCLGTYSGQFTQGPEPWALSVVITGQTVLDKRQVWYPPPAYSNGSVYVNLKMQSVRTNYVFCKHVLLRAYNFC